MHVPHAYADSVFTGMTGMTAPFLIAMLSRASFSNCLFKDIAIQGHALFDVSHGGGVRLVRCRFANVTAGADAVAGAAVSVVDTSYNDPEPLRKNPDLVRLDDYNTPNGWCGGMWLDDFASQPNIDLLPAPPPDGTEWWVENQTAIDANELDLEGVGFGLSQAAHEQCFPFQGGRRGDWLKETDEWLVAMREVGSPGACCVLCVPALCMMPQFGISAVALRAARGQR